MDDGGRIDGHPLESPGLYSNSYALSNEPMNDVMAIVANPEGFSTRSSHDSVDGFSKRGSSILAIRSTQDGSSVRCRLSILLID